MDKDGGQAFPRPDQLGMSLRDYFAAAALQGELAQHDWMKVQSVELAARCYKFADAMLAERAK